MPAARRTLDEENRAVSSYSVSFALRIIQASACKGESFTGPRLFANISWHWLTLRCRQRVLQEYLYHGTILRPALASGPRYLATKHLPTMPTLSQQLTLTLKPSMWWTRHVESSLLPSLQGCRSRWRPHFGAVVQTVAILQGSLEVCGALLASLQMTLRKSFAWLSDTSSLAVRIFAAKQDASSHVPVWWQTWTVVNFLCCCMLLHESSLQGEHRTFKYTRM